LSWKKPVVYELTSVYFFCHNKMKGIFCGEVVSSQ